MSRDSQSSSRLLLDVRDLGVFVMVLAYLTNVGCNKVVQHMVTAKASATNQNAAARVTGPRHRGRVDGP